MNKRAKVFYIVIMLMLLLPSVVMLLAGGESASSENRELASAPVLFGEDGINFDFFNEFDSYVSDHIGFRSQLVAANTAVFTGMFNMSPEDDVILGKDGWLYYGQTMDDYFNIPSVSDRGINSIAHSMKMLQDAVEDKESEFVLTFAPNKSTLYPENLPVNYIPSANLGNLERIEEALIEADVNYISLKDLFEEDEEIYYRKKDSHWSYKGALKAYNAIMNGSTLKHNSYDNLEFADSYEWTGDLSNMLYASGVPLDSQLMPMHTFGYQYTSKQKKVEANRIDTENREGQGKALIYRDSFGNTLIPFFAENFEKCHFSKITPYDMADVETYNPDVTVIELVERNIPNMAMAAPVMLAPETTLEDPGYIVTSANSLYTVYEEEVDIGKHIYGAIDERILGDEYRVYVYVNDGTGIITCYEAFPIYEQFLLDGESEEYPKDNGYSLYVPDVDAEVLNLVVTSDGVNYILKND